MTKPTLFSLLNPFLRKDGGREQATVCMTVVSSPFISAGFSQTHWADIEEDCHAWLVQLPLSFTKRTAGGSCPAPGVRG